MSVLRVKVQLLERIMKLKILSALRIFVLSYKLGIIPKDLYQLFVEYKPLHKDIREFLEGFFKEVIKQC